MGWEFRKAGAAFPYFLFLVSYSLFQCAFAPLRALRETKKIQWVGDFQKAGAAFPYFLFLVSYSLFLCAFAPLRALRETKKVLAVVISRLPMLVFSPIIKEI
jgi:hypothetical protein